MRVALIWKSAVLAASLTIPSPMATVGCKLGSSEIEFMGYVVLSVWVGAGGWIAKALVQLTGTL